jgi:hypothetical protein
VQAVILTLVVLHANDDGRWEGRLETFAREVGRDERNIGGALRDASEIVAIRHRRRADGKQRSSEYALVDRVVKRADDFVRLWTSGKAKSSGRPGSDEIITPLGSDEIVLPGTVLNGSMNGSQGDDSVQPSADEAARVRAIVEEAGFPYGGDA